MYILYTVTVLDVIVLTCMYIQHHGQSGRMAFPIKGGEVSPEPGGHSLHEP